MIPKMLAGALGALALLGACAPNSSRGDVLTTAYPLEFIAARLTDGAPRVRNLVAAGAEPHDLELSPRQVDELLDARLVVTVGNGFQPAVDGAVAKRSGPTVEVLAALPIDAQGKTVAEAKPGEPTPADAIDPHVWLDPVLMRDIARMTGDALITADPQQAEAYRARMTRLDGELVALDEEYRTALAECERRTIVTAHEAFGWLAKRYGLTQYGIAGLDPGSEPSAARLAVLSDLAQQQGVTTIFTEELVSPKVAETVAREAGGLRVETLSPLESRTTAQVAAGDDYFSVMRANLAKLRTALGCT